ncbi:MAG: beta-N-acetylhexosaminidase [Acidothermales bacterium]|nr:beta-N-acetylhexosaminidase [Acidothermales bacterium]
MVVPVPVAVRPGEGSFTLGASTVLRGPAELTTLVRRELAPGTGLPLVDGDAAGGVVDIALDGSLRPEAYRLTVTENAVRIGGGDAAGVFYAVQTLRQLLPPDAFRSTPLPGVAWELPAVEIDDAPRFGWRGCHLDVARHFMPKAFLLRLVDLLAMHKLNVLHLHLTDDQGWRFESHRHPRLTEVGAYRRQTRRPKERRGDGTPHGGYYSQDDLREVVAYAAGRFVTVLPEVELPGHVQAALASYPELGDDPRKPLPVLDTWRVNENVLNPEQSTLRFFQDVFEEVLDVFPGSYVHVGGDECPKKQWERSARARELIEERGVGDENGLQSWFITELAGWLAARGRRLVGWDEILQGGLADGATVMSWRGESGGIAAAKQGHDVVMTPTAYTYFDYYQSDDPREPAAIGGHLPLAHAYAYEPVPSALNEEEAAHVLGSQCQLWTEYMPDPRHVEYMAFPRACAFAEALWSPRERRSFDGFSARLASHLARLDALDVNYRPLDGPRPWQQGGTGRRRRR